MPAPTRKQNPYRKTGWSLSLKYTLNHPAYGTPPREGNKVKGGTTTALVGARPAERCRQNAVVGADLVSAR